MAELSAVLFTYPTVVFTGALGLALLYWISVIFGALDIDAFGGADGLDAVGAKGEAAAGALDALSAKGDAAAGAMDAFAAKGDAAAGAFDGAADAALDGLDGDIDLDADVDADVDAPNILSAFNLRRAPVTVVFSLIAFSGWLMSYGAMRYLAPFVPLPSWAMGTLVLLVSLFLSMPITSLLTKPLEPIFRNRGGKTRADYVGTTCRIQTGRVDSKFGQARINLDGTELVVQVRDDDGSLGRGDQALIVDYDAEREAYVVEAYDAILKQETLK